MKQEQLDLLLDKLVIKAASLKQYKTLSEKQKIIGALEMLISTVTRSGPEGFFNNDFKYLWNDALTGLEKVKADTSVNCYKNLLKELKDSHTKKVGFKKLQEALIKTDFEVIHTGVRKFLMDNPDTANLN